MDFPDTPLAAATHPDPYPYYARLVAERSLAFDAGLGLWIAADAAAVDAVLASALCRVRPPAEPVPTALSGTPAADLFRRLVRMNDGAGHCPLKGALAAALATAENGAAPLAQATAQALARHLPPPGAPAQRAALDAFMFRLPPLVVARLLGVERRHWPALPARVAALVRAFAPGADAIQVAAGAAAADWLLERLRPDHAAAGSLLAALAQAVRSAGCDDDALIAANAAGFLTQAFEASAGLIGNTLLALGRQPGLGAAVAARPGLLGTVMQEVLRFDPPVQNTRRFVAVDGIVAGQQMRAGDGILVLLAAAGRDPAANPKPQRFWPQRPAPRLFCFGAGAHACPGARLAAMIAEAGVAALLAAGTDPAALAGAVRYRPSVNGRMPLFGSAEPELDAASLTKELADDCRDL